MWQLFEGKICVDRLLSRHRKKLTSLFAELQHIAMAPFERGNNCLPLQQNLIKSITSIERQIRIKKLTIKSSRKQLTTRRP
ncbi:MAG: hypothetical protein LZF62_170001 [Nitrospira sp.]|nr:MAG: hypothetical protein LZF62_170001 [Nitrospira sp.]